MANIKISELDELQKATDQDLLVIVDVANNETKKIQAGNLGTGGAEIPIGPTPPENPKDGDFWIDTSANGETYGDTLPIGAIVEYNGTTVPQGYEKVSDGNIIESGSNSKGSWIKYNDGTMIVTRETYEIAININVSWGNIFVGGDYTEWEFPVPFINVPDLVLFDVNPTTSNGCFKTSYEPTKITKNSIQNVYVGRGTSASDVAIKIHILAIGKWK